MLLSKMLRVVGFFSLRLFLLKTNVVVPKQAKNVSRPHYVLNQIIWVLILRLSFHHQFLWPHSFVISCFQLISTA